MSPASIEKLRDGGPCRVGGGGRIPDSLARLRWFSSSSSMSHVFFTAIVVVMGVAVVVLFQSNNAETTGANSDDSIILSATSMPWSISTTRFLKTARILQEQQQQQNNSVDIQEGLVWGSEAYYHCPATINSTNNNKQVQDIVLWHGSSFTKEEWKTKGILQQLCIVEHFSVTALDLFVLSDHEVLVGLLNALQNEQQILTLPVAAIVTPSASGYGIVDWINQDTQGFVDSVQLWVPVACGSVTSLNASKMNLLKNAPYEFPVLAIYGNEDTSGKRLSELLGDEMGAEVVELQGGHPVYLQDPDAFVETLSKKLESLETFNSPSAPSPAPVVPTPTLSTKSPTSSLQSTQEPITASSTFPPTAGPAVALPNTASSASPPTPAGPTVALSNNTSSSAPPPGAGPTAAFIVALSLVLRSCIWL
jgi:hypothetical protein